MKEKDANAKGGHRLVVYVEKEDRTYGPLETGSYMVTNYYDDFADKRRRLEEETLRRLLDGEISPVAYYMILTDISEADLASRAGVSRRKLRKEMTPGGFEKISLAQVKKYAEIFHVPAANFLQIIEIAAEGISVVHEKTAQPLVTRTRVESTRE